MFLTCLPAIAQARFLEKIEETRESAEVIVRSISAGDYTAAAKELRSLSMLAPQRLEVSEAQFNGLAAELSRQYSIGHEYLRSDELGTRLVRHQFLSHYARGPIRWVFLFYRSEGGRWVLMDFRWDSTPMDFFNSPTYQRPQ
jgi:hypothetical protein